MAKGDPPAKGAPTLAASWVAFRAARGLESQGRIAAASKMYARAFALDPVPFFLFEMGELERRQGHWAAAEADYRAYLAASRALATALAESMHVLAAGTSAAHRNLRAVDATVVPAEWEVPRDSTIAPASEDGPVSDSTHGWGASALVAPLVPEPASDGGRSKPSPAVVALATKADLASISSRPAYERWWFWTGLGVLIAGGATAVLLASRSGAPSASLGELNLR